MKPLDPRLLAHARASRGYIIGTAGAGALTAALVVAQVLLIASALGSVVSGGAGWEEIAPTVGWVAAVLAARVAVVTLQERFAHRAADAVITQLRGKVLTAAVDRGPRAFDAAASAELVTLVTRGLDDLAPYFVRYLPQLLMAAILTPATLVVLAAKDLFSGIIIALAIPMIPIFMILVGRMTQHYANRRLKVMDRLGGQLLDLLAGLPTLKALGREQGPGARVRELADAYARTTLQTLKVAFLSGAILEFFASISVALVAVVIGSRLVAGDTSLETALIAIMLAPEVLQPLRQVGAQFHNSANGIAAAEAAFEIIESTSPPSGTVACPPLGETTIAFDGVSVRAPGRALLAPADLSCRIEPGEITALVGPSGAGKSTAALLLLGLLRPEVGTVRLLGPSGHIDLLDVDPASLHAQITWVPQRPTLLPGTVAQNMTGNFSAPVTPTAAMGVAAAQAGLAVEELPRGWDTRIGHGGVGLSVGQRQRLALARALLADTPLVLLDEPTAHLDAATEREVTAAVEAIHRAGRTVVVIAHRPSVVAIASRVVAVSSRATEPAVTGGGAA